MSRHGKGKPGLATTRPRPDGDFVCANPRTVAVVKACAGCLGKFVSHGEDFCAECQRQRPTAVTVH